MPHNSRTHWQVMQFFFFSVWARFFFLGGAQLESLGCSGESLCCQSVSFCLPLSILTHTHTRVHTKYTCRGRLEYDGSKEDVLAHESRGHCSFRYWDLPPQIKRSDSWRRMRRNRALLHIVLKSEHSKYVLLRRLVFGRHVLMQSLCCSIQWLINWLCYLRLGHDGVSGYL